MEIKKLDKCLSVRLLKDEIAGASSPGALTVLPAFGSQARKAATATEKPTSTDGTKPTETGKLVASKRTISWAEIASRGKS